MIKSLSKNKHSERCFHGITYLKEIGSDNLWTTCKECKPSTDVVGDWKERLNNILGDRKELIGSLQLTLPPEKIVKALKYFDETKRQLMELISQVKSKTKSQIVEQILEEKKNHTPKSGAGRVLNYLLTKL